MVAAARAASAPCAVHACSTAAADVRAVDDVVVDQRRHVDELHGDPFDHRRLGSRRGGEERERRPQPLAARSQRVGADRRDGAGMCRDDQLEALLDRDEVVGEPVDRADGLERANDGFLGRDGGVQRDDRPAEQRDLDPLEAFPLEQAAARSSAPGKAARWPGGTCTPCRRG